MGRAGMEKNMEVPEGTKSGSSVWFSSPTPRHRYTHGIMNKIDAPFGHIYLCVRAHMRMRDGLRGRGWGGGWGSGWSPCKPRDCLRQAKGAPDGDGTAGRRVSWKPNANAEGLAGRAEATQVCSGSRGPGQPLPAAREGLGLRGGDPRIGTRGGG